MWQSCRRLNDTIPNNLNSSSPHRVFVSKDQFWNRRQYMPMAIDYFCLKLRNLPNGMSYKKSTVIRCRLG